MSSTSLKPPTAAQRAEFESGASISFPASATLVGWREEEGMDSAMWLKLKMPVKDFAAFIERSPLRETALTSDDTYQVYQFHEFIPTAPARYRAGQQPLPNGRVLNILADESDATTVIVYLMLHEK